MDLFEIKKQNEINEINIEEIRRHLWPWKFENWNRKFGKTDIWAWFLECWKQSRNFEKYQCKEKNAWRIW